MVIRPHDLIEVSNLEYLSLDEDKEWVTASLRRTPFVVIRRAEPSADGCIPVGIRGTERNQREAALLDPEGVCQLVSPYAIAERQMWNSLSATRRQQPVLQVMDLLAEIMLDWRWGPVGSAGFEIVTQYPAVKETSDLDLVIDGSEVIDYAAAERLMHKLEHLDVRIDIQLETRDGAYVLREILERRASSVVLRTSSGPKLVRNPWQ
ncbi:phosphoribosyl-dephospho-CoA transferase [Paenibacillus terrae HPL-003]|uniref:Phosphoribosyl-dephospho-CoA transferase n=1 Tax=Paenibacillus terrae (strain HPL-003) TaxID=985665 RepID=G7VP71_PAETH|nr:malonate decarboxylase holo-ACP synthase [Paenibacillus terrae]AET60948.1 phosphoribosyl-dephospho-CoA transferase [Paenibacillus terrae HPL-003]